MPQNETAPAEVQAPGQAALEEGLAKRAETNQLVAEAREGLGQVATRREVHTDVHGNILSDRDLQALARGNTEVKQ
jgi:hypothetical protein